MATRPLTHSTADERRETVIRAAIVAFSRSGFHATPISQVAEEAGISPAYVFKLFPGKVSLFVAALDRCYDLIAQGLEDGAQRSKGSTSGQILSDMGAAYAELIADRDLLMLQVHAQAAMNEPAIRLAVSRGLERLTMLARNTSGASDLEVQHFMAFGQLCHLLTTVHAFDRDEQWARILTSGIRHYPETEGR